jgi:hypothetical protein
MHHVDDTSLQHRYADITDTHAVLAAAAGSCWWFRHSLHNTHSFCGCCCLYGLPCLLVTHFHHHHHHHTVYVTSGSHHSLE